MFRQVSRKFFKLSRIKQKLFRNVSISVNRIYVNSQTKKTYIGSYIWKTRFPWWSSGKECACRCRGHRFNSWYRKISHAAEQLSLRATATEVHAPRAIPKETATTRSPRVA